MVKKIRNKKGFIYPQVVVIGVIMAVAVGRGIDQTAKNGVLKKNGQTIWCKVQNKGAAYCDATYK